MENRIKSNIALTGKTLFSFLNTTANVSVNIVVIRNLKFSLCRWRDIVFYAFVGALFFIYGGNAASKLDEELQTLVPPGDLQMVLLFIFSALCLWKVNDVIGLRLQHFKHTLSYPSVTVAIPLALVMAVFLPHDVNRGIRTLDTYLLVSSITFYFLVTTVPLVISTLRRLLTVSPIHKEEKLPFPKQRVLETLSNEEIKKWIEREDPIESPCQDYFGLADRVQRMVTALKHPTTQTVAIVGSFGCGKSSLVNLVKGRAIAIDSPKLLFCKVSCWGFDDSSAAQEVILNHVIGRLSEEIDCFNLRGLSNRYIQALSKTSGVLDAMLQLVNARPDPLSTLQEFTPGLSSIGARLVVVIEDVDRNGARFEVSHIQALLERVRHVEGLSFIICAGQNAQIAFSKLCEHIETIPDLEEDRVLALADRVRKICQEKYPEDIDPLQERDSLDKISPRWAGLWMSTYTSWQVAFARLARTPRLLKRTLLRFEQAWQCLHGEVDIDELLIVCCLRICSPPAFQFVCQHYAVLGNLSERNSGRMEQEDNKNQTARLSEIWRHVEFEADVDRHSAACLIQKLLPSSVAILHERSYSNGKSFQGIKVGGSINYFDRLISESLRESEVRDQSVLRLLFATNENEKSIPALAKGIISSHAFAITFEHFSGLLREERLLLLCSQVYADSREMNGNKADRDSPGFSELWRIARRQMKWKEEYRRWPIGEIEPSVPKNLSFLTDLYYFWLSEETRLAQKRFRKTLLRICQKKFQNISPREFADGFDHQYPYTLFHLIFTSEYEEKPPPPITGPRFWKWLAPLLLATANAEPLQIIPQIAFLLLSRSAGNRNPSSPLEYNFDEQLLSEFFGGVERETLLALSKPLDFPWNFDSRVKEMLALVPNRAAELIKKSFP